MGARSLFVLTTGVVRCICRDSRVSTLAVIYQCLILAGLVFALIGVLVNVANFSGLRPVEPPAADDAPLVSILVPARNEARCIEACVGSLLKQDYPNYELIMLDDHSED